MKFMQKFAEASEHDKKIVFRNLERWWKRSPMYKRKRLLNTLTEITRGTAYETKINSNRQRGIESDDFIELGVIRV